MTMLLTRYVAAVAVLLSCEGNAPPCGQSFGPLTIPGAPHLEPVTLRYAVAVTTQVCALDDAGSSICPLQINQFNLLFTPTPDACPGPGSAVGETNAHDFVGLWVGLQTPLTTPFGTYDIASNEWDTANIFGEFGPFIATVFVAKGARTVNGVLGLGASGSVVITNFVPGERIVGHLSATFSDGTPLAMDFDAPICASCKH